MGLVKRGLGLCCDKAIDKKVTHLPRELRRAVEGWHAGHCHSPSGIS